MADDNASEEAVGAEMHDVIAGVMGKHGLMVTKWMLIAEGLDDDGQRALATYASPDFRSWDAVGFLGFFDARERGVLGADAVAEETGEDDPGE